MLKVYTVGEMQAKKFIEENISAEEDNISVREFLEGLKSFALLLEQEQVNCEKCLCLEASVKECLMRSLIRIPFHNTSPKPSERKPLWYMEEIRRRYSNFSGKCGFLRFHCGAETMEKARELWELTSNWMHAGSLAKKIRRENHREGKKRGRNAYSPVSWLTGHTTRL